MKHKLLLFLLLLMLITLVGCTNTTDPDYKSPQPYHSDEQINDVNNDWLEETACPVDIGERLCDIMGFPDQSVPPKFEWINLSDTDDIETGYDNFIITLDSDQFRYNSQIRIHIRNNNGKPYAFYPIPYVEKYNSSSQKWERLIYAPDEVYYASGWYTGIDAVTLYFNPYYVSTPVETGKYRFIVFAGEHEFYSPEFYITK